MPKSAKRVGDEIGIDKVIAEVLPTEKLDNILTIQEQGKKVLFVGDGINDAPAISIANIGIALGTGSDIATESGDIIIIEGNLENVVVAIEFSKEIIRRIKKKHFLGIHIQYNPNSCSSRLTIPIIWHSFQGRICRLSNDSKLINRDFIISNAKKLQPKNQECLSYYMSIFFVNIFYETVSKIGRFLSLTLLRTGRINFHDKSLKHIFVFYHENFWHCRNSSGIPNFKNHFTLKNNRSYTPTYFFS